MVPSERVRKMEVKANEAIDVYRELWVFVCVAEPSTVTDEVQVL